MIKQLLDRLLSLIGLVVCSPLILAVMISVRVGIGKLIFFRQQRPGYKGKPFIIYKFRTMTDHRDDKGNLLSDEDRLTPFGKFLRSTSLDELPELFNVLKGDMSLVGPRPLLMQYLPLYSLEQMRRHDVRPGITGWAQINGRNAISWEDKFEFDVWYVDHHSLFLDFKILFFTIWKTLRREGIMQDGHVTADKFVGSRS